MTNGFLTYTAYAKQPPPSGGTAWLVTVKQPDPSLPPIKQQVLGTPFSYDIDPDDDPYEVLYQPVHDFIIGAADLDPDTQFAISIIITR